MQATVPSKEFRQALGKLALLPGAKDRTVVLRVVGAQLFAEVAGSGAFLTVGLEATDTVDGIVAVDGEALMGLSAPDKTLTLTSMGGGKLKFKSGKLSGTTVQYQDERVKSLDAQRPSVSQLPVWTVNVPLLLKSLRLTKIVPSTPMPSHGTRMIVQNGRLSVSCADVFRAALFTTEATDFTGEFDVFMPTDFLANLLAYADVKQASFGLHGGTLRFLAGDISGSIPTIQQRKNEADVASFFSSLRHQDSVVRHLHLTVTVG